MHHPLPHALEHLEQQRPTSFTPWEVTMREAAQQESIWLFDAYA